MQISGPFSISGAWFGQTECMTTLKDTLKTDLTAAMKAGDDVLKSTLRMAIAAVMNAEVAGSEAVALSDDQVLKILQAETKKRDRKSVV